MSIAAAARLVMGSGAAPRSGMRRASPRGLSGWTEDLGRAIKAEDLRKLNTGVLDTMDSVAKAHDALNEFEDDLNGLDARKAQVAQEFGAPFTFGFIPLPNWPALVALEPLLHAEANLKVGGRRLAAIDVLFYELSLTYTGMGNAFQQAGLAAEANSLRRAAQLMRDWSAALQARVVSRMPSIADDREAINANFQSTLSAKGLRHIVDDDKPGYFDALAQVLAVYTEQPAPEEARATMQGAQLGADPVSISIVVLGIVKVVIIVGGIVAIAAFIASAVKSIFGASEEAMGAARELQRRKTLREQQVTEQVQANENAVAEGQISREEADERNRQAREEAAAENEKDGQDFRAEVGAAAEAAAKGRPGIEDLLLYVGVPVLGIGALAVGLKIAKII